MFSDCEISVDLCWLQAPRRVIAELNATIWAARRDGRFVLHMNNSSIETWAWFGDMVRELCSGEVCALNLSIQR